jgi:hypothetical protein
VATNVIDCLILVDVILKSQWGCRRQILIIFLFLNPLQYSDFVIEVVEKNVHTFHVQRFVITNHDDTTKIKDLTSDF